MIEKLFGLFIDSRLHDINKLYLYCIKKNKRGKYGSR